MSANDTVLHLRGQVLDQLIDAARKDGHDTATIIAINVVDTFLDSSQTLDEFRAKWASAKGLWQELEGETVSDVARRIGREAAGRLRDELAILQEHRP